MLQLRTINAMSGQEFSETFCGVYESSRWVAERAFAKAPFGSAHDLQSAFRAEVENADTSEQEALILAHPDLAGKLARAGQLTAESSREQARLNLSQLDDETFATFDHLNRSYRDRFGFPFIICVGLLQDCQQVLEAFHARLNHSPAEERREALHQIHLIAALRLAALVEGLTAP